MKRLFLLVALLMSMSMTTHSWAAHVSQSAARAVAQRFWAEQSVNNKSVHHDATLQLVHTVTNSHRADVAVLYVFSSADGFVVVSGEDRAREVLAYGDSPINEMKDLPANMRYWLECYKRQLEYLQDHPSIKVSVPLLNDGRAAQSVNPLISANWSQNAPYWNECPAFGNDTCFTGCPATSLSMVFHYWRYPRQQTPLVPSYVLPTYGVALPDLPPTVFDWDNMLDAYTGGYNDEQAAAVAHLMRYIGQVEQMDYTISGSGAYGQDVLRAVKFFEYDQNAQHLFKTDDLGYAYYTDDQWAALIQGELVAGRPIVYLAYDNLSGSGHAFNVDGYDASDDTYHINWGWNGRGNGNFALNAFSYGDYTFGTGQQMVIGIQPPEDYQNARLQAYPKVLDLQAYPGKTVTANISLKGTNLTGDVHLALNDPDGVFAITATTVDRAVAEAGTDISVTYAPLEVGNSIATIVCTSPGTDDLVITLNGVSPLEIYPPVLMPVDESHLTLTSFLAQWTDETPEPNVESYMMEVYAKPDYMLIEEADFSQLPSMAPSNQASHATDYLPQGWSFTGSEFNLEGGSVMPRRNGVITTDALSLQGYDKVTVVVTARSYSSWGDPSELTISTSQASETIDLPFSYGTTTVVLPCVEGDRVAFKAGYYPMIQKIQIYAGDASGAVALRSEADASRYRLITGIHDKHCVVKDLAAGGSFFYHVKALYSDGTQSDWSDTRMVTLSSGGHDYQMGDVDRNGQVGMDDLSALINYSLTGDENGVCLVCADLTDDGNVGMDDLSALINLLLSGEF